MPTIPELIKQKLKVQTLSKPQEGGGRTTAGDLKMKDIVEMAKTREGGKSAAKMILGTCVSCGVTVDGKNPKDVIKEIEEGKHDSLLA
jgi:large subunit ribosomal protein L11